MNGSKEQKKFIYLILKSDEQESTHPKRKDKLKSDNKKISKHLFGTNSHQFGY